MKVFATYDRSGNIVGVAIAAADVKDGEFHLVAEPGHHVSELDVPSQGKKGHEDLIANLIQNFRVEQSAASASLLKIAPPVSRRSKSRA
jgi:hypothetical protein